MSKGHSLSEINYSSGEDHSEDSIAIVVSKWNTQITGKLYQGAEEALQQGGVALKNIKRVEVPGSFELPLGAQIAIESSLHSVDAVICLGCVIQGETRHFDFICQSVAKGIMDLNLKYTIPVIFGVLTPENEDQARARAGGNLGNKGKEAAVAALEMIDLSRVSFKG